MTRGPLFAAGADSEGQGTQGSRGWWAWSFGGRQVQATVKQLRWLCFTEDCNMSILGPMWHRAGCAVTCKSVRVSV